jgi:biotin-(acetyl-CoA carboxylase) ligase
MLLGCLDDARGVSWKAPNDLVAASGGAKAAGILVDARMTGDVVDELIVGIGCNLEGPEFTTSDGRSATSLAQLGAALDVDRFLAQLAQRLTPG